MDYEKIPNKINRGISIIIYGDPGVGKTTLAATLPEKETLIITCEAGLGPLLGTKHVVFDVLKAVDPVTHNIEAIIDDLYKFLRTEKHSFKNVVVDNLSELHQQLIINLTKKHNRDAPDRRIYGDASYKMRDWVRLFRDLVYQDVNVVLNAWEFLLEVTNQEGTIVTKTFPLISKTISPACCGLVDVVGRLECNEKTQQRRIRVGQNDQYITKSQFQGLNPAEPPDLPLLFKKLNSYEYGKEQ
jgi:phage nucleotide-binding protein